MNKHVVIGLTHIFVIVTSLRRALLASAAGGK